MIIFGENCWMKDIAIIFGPHQAKKCLRTCANKCRFVLACACAKYNLGLCSPFMHSVVSNDSVSGQWRPWSYCADAQANLGLLCPHMPEVTFWHNLAHLMNKMFSLLPVFYLYISLQRNTETEYGVYLYKRDPIKFCDMQNLHHTLTLVMLNSDISCLCKQCRSRSVGFWRSTLIWIGTVCHLVCEFVSQTWIK